MNKPRGITTCLGLFAKYWQVGRVKTRLIGRWSAAVAADFHRQCVLTARDRFRHLGNRRLLVVSPPESATRFVDIAGSDWQLAVQSPGDLGERMRVFFQQAFDEGAHQVVLLGTDSPHVPLAYIRQAFVQLERHAVVLGPAEDGGYYLIGAARQVPPVFDGIAWGGPDVFSQSVERLDRQGITWTALPGWYDIDRPADVQRLATELANTEDEDLIGLRVWLRRALG